MVRTRRPIRGFTLVEVLLASVILAMSVVAIVQAVAVGQTQTYEALHEARGTSLAEALVEEVLAYPYDPIVDNQLGAEAGETARSLFNSPTDFSGLNEIFGQVSDVAGNVYASPYDRFARSITLTKTTLAITGFAGPPQAGLSVVVTVTDDRGRTWVISRFVPEQ